MPRFLSRPPHIVLAGLTLLAGPAAAQIAPPAVTPPPPAPVVHAPMTSPAPVTGLDPQAALLFDQAIAAQQAVAALSATITATSAGLGADSTQTLTLAFQKPNQARIAVADAAGPVVQFVSDGKTLTIYAVHDKKYRADPIPPGADVIPAVLVQAHALLPRLIAQPQALRDLLAQPGVIASVVQFDALGSTVGGVPTETVAVTLPAPDGSKVQFTFACGKADHLLRRVTQSATITTGGSAKTFTRTETITKLDVTPTLTAADFAFTPPPGVAKIAATVPPAGQNSRPMYDPRLVPGAKPLAFAAKDLGGKPLALAQYKGKVVLMDFWATWCGPCVGEMPNVIAAYKKFHARGFEIVGISLDQSRPALTAFIAQNKMPWRQVFDGKGWSSAVPRRYGVMAIPFGLLIGRDGKIAAVDVRGPALTAAIKLALAKGRTSRVAGQ